MNRKAVIVALVALNVLLAGLLLRQSRAQLSPQAISAPQASPATGLPDRSTHRPAGASTDRSVRRAPGPTQAWNWQALDSPDLPQLIANLRAVGCPEQTVRDIVLGRINRQFAAREAQLQLRPEHVNPWEAARWTASERRAKQRQLRELERHKRRLLKELLGIDQPPDLTERYSSGDLPRVQAAYAALPDTKRELVFQIQEQFWDQLEELEERTRGYWEPEDLAEYRRLRAQYNQALAEVLTGTELEDFLIATSPLGRQLRTELAAFAPSDQELRLILRLRQQFPDLFDPPPDYEPSSDPQAAAQLAQAQHHYEQQLKAALGETRYADYQRAQDPQYKILARLVQEAGLSPEVTRQAYEVQQAALAHAQRLRTDPSLDPEQRRQALRTAQAELNKTLLQLLGDRGFQAWQRAGGAPLYLERRPGNLPSPP